MAHTIKGGLALDIGNTKIHAQVRSADHQLLDEWRRPTEEHASLHEIIEQSYQRAKKLLGSPPGFVGLGFGGPVDPKTGSAKLSLVTKFSDSVTTRQVSEMLGGIPVAHFNDVAASAHALAFPHFELDTTLLTKNARLETGPSVLVEIGTGVGIAYCLPDGTVMPSEAVRIHASNGRPYGLNLCGSIGFKNLTQELQQGGVAPPTEVEEALGRGDTLGPLITGRIAGKRYANLQDQRHRPDSEGRVRRRDTASTVTIVKGAKQ